MHYINALYTKDEIDSKVKAVQDLYTNIDLTQYYTKNETNSFLDKKIEGVTVNGADATISSKKAIINLPQPDLSSYATKDELDSKVKAFQSLQTQVDNSAVGTNLLTNTGDLSANWNGFFTISTTTEYDGHPSVVFTPSSPLVRHDLDVGKLQNSTQYTASFWAKADNAGDKAHTELFGGIGATDFVLTTDWVRYTAVLTSRSDAGTNILHSMYFFGVPARNIGNVYIAEPKLELGTTATDWCPNPSEILTKGDTVVKEVTQAEYDALTTKDPNTIYYVWLS